MFFEIISALINFIKELRKKKKEKENAKKN